MKAIISILILCIVYILFFPSKKPQENNMSGKQTEIIIEISKKSMTLDEIYRQIETINQKVKEAKKQNKQFRLINEKSN